MRIQAFMACGENKKQAERIMFLYQYSVHSRALSSKHNYHSLLIKLADLIKSVAVTLRDSPSDLH